MSKKKIEEVDLAYESYLRSLQEGEAEEQKINIDPAAIVAKENDIAEIKNDGVKVKEKRKTSPKTSLSESNARILMNREYVETIKFAKMFYCKKTGKYLSIGEFIATAVDDFMAKKVSKDWVSIKETYLGD